MKNHFFFLSTLFDWSPDLGLGAGFEEAVVSDDFFTLSDLPILLVDLLRLSEFLSLVGRS